MHGDILLVGSSEKSHLLLQTLVPSSTYRNTRYCQSASETRRIIAVSQPEIMVINTPLNDESGLELAMDMARNTSIGIILLVKADLADIVSSKVEEYGVMVLSKPVAKPLFDQTLRIADIMNTRMATLQAENERLQKKLADQKLIDRAKCVLIQYLGMTEEEAHRHIEKQAMDTRETRTAVARTILSTYEL